MSTSKLTAEQLRAQYLKQIEKKKSRPKSIINPTTTKFKEKANILKDKKKDDDKKKLKAAIASGKIKLPKGVDAKDVDALLESGLIPKDVDINKVVATGKLPEGIDVEDVKVLAETVKKDKDSSASDAFVTIAKRKLQQKLLSKLFDSQPSTNTKQKSNTETVVYANSSKTIAYTQLIVQILSLASFIAIAFGIFRIDQFIRENM